MGTTAAIIGGVGVGSSLLSGALSEPSQSSPVVAPGVLSRDDARRFAMLAGNLFSTQATPEIGQLLQNILMNPQFGPQNAAESNLIRAAQGTRQAQFNALGIPSSPLSQTAVAAHAAPSLLQFRQNRISNLGSAFNLFNQLQLGQAQGLGNLAQLGNPIPLGQESTGPKTFPDPFNISATIPLGGAGGAGGGGG